MDSAADIAREASDIILLDRSLSVIIEGIERGRKIFTNTIKYIKSTLASNFGNFFAIAIATFIIDYLPMLPLQILLVNLLSDFPMISISTDEVDQSELKKPKSYQIKDVIIIAFILGAISMVFDFLIFAIFVQVSPQALHTNWFIGSILTELILIYSIRTRLPFYKAKAPSKLIIWLTATITLVTVILPFTYVGHRIFGFISPTSSQLLSLFVIIVVYFFISEAVKLKYYHYIDNGHKKKASAVSA